MAILPSTSLYVTNACAPLIARWWDLPGIMHERPLHRLSANSFATRDGDWLVLVRRDTPAAMARAALAGSAGLCGG